MNSPIVSRETDKKKVKINRNEHKNSEYDLVTLASRTSELTEFTVVLFLVPIVHKKLD